MKVLTMAILPVSIDIDMRTVKEVKFVFCQGKHRLMFDYPSDRAVLNEDTQNIELTWTLEDTAMFNSGRVEMDTFIRLKDSDINPETEIVSFPMNRTLFTVKEVTVDD